MESPIRVFIACAPNYEDAESQAVLEWSIRKLASMPVEITFMHLSNDTESPFYGWETSGWATPFSGFRWAVPELCGFKGRAIYMDSDFIFLADIAELWTQELHGDSVAIGKGGDEWRICCCLFDCEKAEPHMTPINIMKTDSRLHGRMNMHFRKSKIVQTFVDDWNNLDCRKGESLNDIKALHYTRMGTQPQIPYALPRLESMGLSHWFDGDIAPHPRQDITDLFGQLLIEAAENGYPVDKYMRHELFGPINKRSFKGHKVPA